MSIKMKKVIFLFLCLFISLWSFSCKQDVPSFTLAGQVVESLGAYPIEGATVTLKGSERSTLTDANGFFQFTELPPGLYDVVAQKSGRAGSQIEQFNLDRDCTDLILVQMVYSYDPLATTPPNITINGVQRNYTYNGIVKIDVSVAPGSCPVLLADFHRSIYFKIGLTKMNYYVVADSDDASLSYSWNSDLLPPGEAEICVVAYDNNNNRSEYILPVNIAPRQGQAPGEAPINDYFIIIANTYNKSMNYTRTTDSRSPVDGTITVEVSAARYYNGIVVYRALTADGDYVLAGQTPHTESGNYNFMDYSPLLTADMTVYYKLAYYNSFGIGPLTEPISVRILPKYTINLVAPPNNSFVGSTKPMIFWSCNTIEGAQRTDWIIVRNVLDPMLVTYSFEIDKTNYRLPDLLYNNKYEWDIRSYYEYNNSQTNANVVSRSFPGGRSSSDYSSNGAFYFTVRQ